MKKYPSPVLLLITSLLILLITFLSACSAGKAPAREFVYSGEALPMEVPAAPMKYEQQTSPASPEFLSDSTGSMKADVDRIVIRNGSLEIVVDTPPDSMKKISKLAEELGGYVVSASMTEEQLDSGLKVPRATITIRVPAEKFDEAMEAIKSESNRLPLRENIDSQDVTSEYTDLQSRLRNLKNTEEQLLKIQEEAYKTEDVLQVYERLVQVREQIEVIQGQINYYNESSQKSAISVTLIANEAVQPLTIGHWQPVGVAKDAVQALINTVKVLANIAIWLVIFVLPILLLLYVIFFLPLSLIWKAWRRRVKQKKLAAATPPPAPPANPES